MEKRVYDKLERLKNDIVNMMEENANLLSNLTKVESEENKIKNHLDETQKELEKLNVYNQKLQSRKSEFKKKGLPEEISELHSMHRSLVIDNDKFKKKQSNLKEELNKLNQELMNARKENELIRSSVEIISYFFNHF